MEQRKSHIPAEQFNRASCKLNQNTMKKGAIVEAWAHQDLLDEAAQQRLQNDCQRETKCCPEHCKDCTCVLC